MTDSKLCWIITDGSAGMENQALGLAEALGISYEVKRVAQRFPWKYISPFIRLGQEWCVAPEKSSPLKAPWPDIIIASGRQSILPALWVKDRSDQKTRLIYIQNPAIGYHHFDAVVIPQHDVKDKSTPLPKNVFLSIGAPHRITPARLEQEKKDHAKTFAAIPGKKIGILLGGSNKTYTFDNSTAALYLRDFEDLINQDYSLLITPSRRTDPKIVALLKDKLGDRAYIWDGTGDNPYFGILAWSDYIFVTCDSVCMICEACATDRPVYILELPGGNQKFKTFHQNIINHGRANFWDGKLEDTSPPKLNETQEIAKKLASYLNLKGSIK